MKSIILIGLLCVLSSCTSSQFDNAVGADGKIFNIIDEQLFDIRLDNLVCDPFSEADVQLTNGLKASLFSVEPNTLDSAYAVIDRGVKSKQQLYLSKLNIPTRSFLEGFPTVTGDLLRDDNGTAIFEWFGLEIESELKLGINDAEGWYDIGILSDDGSRVYADGLQIIDNDGLQETRMGCSTKKFYFTKKTRLPIKIKYFQGPKEHISLVPLMKKIDSESTPQDPSCGEMGNDLYFDAENNSAPQKAYHDLVARGWKPMTLENWGIPGGADGKFNPCADGEVVIMTDLKVDISNEDQIKLTWKTDKDATSQAIFKNERTGKKVTVAGDRIMSKNHQIILPISNRADIFEVTAVSITRNLGKAISDPVKAELP